MALNSRTLTISALAIAATLSSATAETTNPKGIWYDHNGRGAIEITDCANGNGLCGYVVHVTTAQNADRCGMQILGNVTANGDGWIYSPSRNKKYAVRLNQLNDDRLNVVGNANSRLFSKSYIWKRAPQNIAFCGNVENQTASNNLSDKTELPIPANADTLEADSQTAEIIAPSPQQETRRERIRRKLGKFLDKISDNRSANAERKCKLRLPYVDRVIMVSCRENR